MQNFMKLIVKFRIPVIVSCLVLTVIFGYFIKDIRMDNDFLHYLQDDDPDVQFFKKIGNQFHGNYMIIVGIEADNIFSYPVLSRIRKITQAIENLDGVEKVMSLTNILDIKKIEGGLDVGKLVDKNRIPQNPDELQNLRTYTLSKEMYQGSLISDDGRMSAIVIQMKDDALKDVLAARIKEAANSIEGEGKLYYAGFPMVMEFMGQVIRKDMGKLIPIVIIVVIVILFLSFGHLRGVILPLSTVIISTVWAMGLMVIFGRPLTMISSIMPVVLISSGTAYGIHMLHRMGEKVNDSGLKIVQIVGASSEVGLPIFMAGLTTFAGFISLIFSTLRLFKDFGLFTALGIIFCLLISMTFIPAILTFLPIHRHKVKSEQKNIKKPFEKIMDVFAGFILKKEKIILVGTLVFILILAYAIPKLKSEVNFLSYFSEGSEPRVAEDKIKEKFGGSTPFSIHVDGDIKNPFVLKEIELLEKYLRITPHIKHPQSMSALIGEMNNTMNDRYSIPPTREGVANLWFFLEGQDILDQMIDTKETQALLSGKVDEFSTGVITRTIEDINKILKNNIRRELMVINLENQPEEIKKKYLDVRLRDIITRIKLDLQYYSVRPPADDEIKNVINKEMINPFIDQIKMKEAVITYLLSNESDIPLKSENIAGQLAEKISIKSDIDEKQIEKVLLDTLPQDIINEDPKAVSPAAKSLYVLIQGVKQEAKVERMLIGLETLSGNSSGKRKELISKLKGDLWQVNEQFMAVDRLQYYHINGQYPANENLININYRLSGFTVILKNINDQLYSSQIQSLVMSVLLILALLIFQLRSLSGGLISIIPILLTIIANFGVMSYFGVPLDNATMMVASVAIGMGIDYTIHFITRFKLELSRNNINALGRTLETTGFAILINTLAVMLGFLVLIFSSIVPLQRFGWLIALTMALSMFSAVVLYPAIILYFKPKFVKNNN